MKKIYSQLLSCAVMALSITAAERAPATTGRSTTQAPAIRISDPSLCVDGMQTFPESDELAPILIANISCKLPQEPISI